MFEVPDIYTDLKPIGVGGFGLVCSGTCPQEGISVAIKKLKEPFSNPILSKRAYREFVLLKHLVHDNIINLLDVFISPSNDMYLVTELCSTDLHQVISTQNLEVTHIRYFIYQMLRALKYVHSAGVIHRDIKPSNILLNESCDLKICDFGLARVSDPDMQQTGYVATRYYRAPEIMLFWQAYDKAVDIWSIGCIFAEMLRRKILFEGRDHIHQFGLIVELLGTPDDELVSTITNENTLNYIRNLPKRSKVNLKDYLQITDDDAVDLLTKMLEFNPKKRITAEEALAHPFLSDFHDPEDEPSAETNLETLLMEQDLDSDGWKAKIMTEIESFASFAVLHQME